MMNKKQIGVLTHLFLQSKLHVNYCRACRVGRDVVLYSKTHQKF